MPRYIIEREVGEINLWGSSLRSSGELFALPFPSRLTPTRGAQSAASRPRSLSWRRGGCPLADLDFDLETVMVVLELELELEKLHRFVPIELGEIKHVAVQIEPELGPHVDRERHGVVP